MDRRVFVVPLFAAILPACGSEADPKAPPTYHADVAPLLERSCQSCHVPGGIAPFALVDYAGVKSLAGSIAASTADRSMPPFLAQETDECKTNYPWVHDMRLSQDEIDMLAAWAKAGAPEGDPKTAPPHVTPPSIELSRVDLEVGPKAPFVTSGDTDQFRCFVLDPALTETKYVNGMQVAPGNALVVHHALTFRSKRADMLAKADANGQFDCLGSPQGDLVHTWTPGGVPLELPKEIGVPMTADDVFVMQIHYHPTGPAADPDATRFQVRFSDTPPDYQFLIAFVGNQANQSDGLMPGEDDNGPARFFIPAGKKNHVEEMIFHVPPLPGVEHVKMFAIFPHMHYAGRDMRVQLDRLAAPEGEHEQECLVQTPDWRFDWQRFFSYDLPIDSLPKARPGDLFTLRCTYDNSLDNPYLKRALSAKGMPVPVDIELGEQSLDEMCLIGLGLLAPRDFVIP